MKHITIKRAEQSDVDAIMELLQDDRQYLS